VTRRHLTVAVILTLVSACLCGCSPGAEATPSDAPDVVRGPVTGTIRGTDVRLAGAEYDGQLSLYAGEGWGFNPSLLLFLFLENDEIPAGRTIEVDPRVRMDEGTPHVHYRWFDATGEIDTDAAIEGYTLKLSFGEPMNGLLPGTIEFAVPGEDTRVGGAFVAALR